MTRSPAEQRQAVAQHVGHGEGRRRSARQTLRAAGDRRVALETDDRDGEALGDVAGQVAVARPHVDDARGGQRHWRDELTEGLDLHALAWSLPLCARAAAGHQGSRARAARGTRRARSTRTPSPRGARRAHETSAPPVSRAVSSPSSSDRRNSAHPRDASALGTSPSRPSGRCSSTSRLSATRPAASSQRARVTGVNELRLLASPGGERLVDALRQSLARERLLEQQPAAPVEVCARRAQRP